MPITINWLILFSNWIPFDAASLASHDLKSKQTLYDNFALKTPQTLIISNTSKDLLLTRRFILN